MKFITFALILQFLIACWPKVDIISYHGIVMYSTRDLHLTSLWSLKH